MLINAGIKHQDDFKHKKGTTTLGFVFNDGVLIAVDSRATMGPFISSQTFVSLSLGLTQCEEGN